MLSPETGPRRKRSSATPYREYLRWNEQLHQYFLQEEAGSKPLYLDPDPELFKHLEDRFQLEPGTGEERLIETVRAVLHSAQSSQEIFSTITREVHLWRRDARTKSGEQNYFDRALPPPVTAALVVFVVAAQQMQESEKNGKYVASTNYYTHLLKVLGIDPAHSDRLRQDFKVTEEYWEAFNWWLEDMDGRFGLPTAQATNQRYVGLPVSQAIIRQTDRDAFKRMFSNYALLPGAALSPVEMASLLGEWTGTRNSGVTTSFVKKWNQGGEVRDRIVDAAITELQSWDGDLEQVERTGQQRGSAATVSSAAISGWVPLALIPRGRNGDVELADLGIALRRATAESTWTLAHEEGAVPLRPRVLSATHEYAAGYEIGVESDQLLSREIRLTDGQGNTSRRVPRNIVLLAHDDASGAYIETRRAVPGVRHRILVSPDATPEMIEELRTLLELTSFAGNKDLEVDGIDPDWLVIDGFVPAAAANERDFSSEEVRALLAPIQTQFTLQGGLRFPGRLKKWHAMALPDVVVTVEPGEKASFQLRAVPVTGEGTGRLICEDIRAAAVIQLPLDLGEEDFRIQLYKTPGRGKSIASASPLQTEMVRLRTGESPHDYEGLHHHAGAAHDERPLAAVKAFEDIPEESVTVLGVDVLAENGTVEVGYGAPAETDWSSRHQKQSTVRERISLPSPSAQSCLVTGSHRFQFPTFERGKITSRWQTGICGQCGAVKRTPTRHFDALKPEIRAELEARKGRTLAAQRFDGAQTSSDISVQLPLLEDVGVSTEVVVDALVHMWSGTSESLQTLAERAASENQMADRSMLLRELSSLGLIETLRDDAFRRIRWEVVPPSVLTLADGRVALGGAWPSHRLDDLRNVVADLEAELHLPTSLGELPTVEGASVEDLMEYTDLDGIANAETSWFLLAGQLPSLSEVADALPRRNMALENGPFQMYRFDALSWMDVAGWDAPGLYRRDRGYHRRDYWFRTEQDVEQGTAAAVDVELGKHLLALKSGRPLLGYNAERRELSVPMGARLPELYERAAVMCSGRLPGTSFEGFSHIYSEVPQDLAAALHHRMTS